MSKLKVFIAALIATVCIDSTPTSALAVSYQEKINDSQSTGSPSFDAHNLLDAPYADKAYDDLVRRIAQSSPTIEPKCEGLRDGAKCWKELANLPGCFVWEDNLNMAQSLTWSGKCNNGVGSGRGTLIWTSNGISHQQVGTITNGKQSGFWTTRDPDGGEGEGPFVDGENTVAGYYVTPTVRCMKVHMLEGNGTVTGSSAIPTVLCLKVRILKGNSAVHGLFDILMIE